MNRINIISALLIASLVSACGGGGGGSGSSHTSTPASSSSSTATSSSSSSSSSSSQLSSFAATVSLAAASADSRLACYKGTGTAACDLRTYQIMVESFIDGDSTTDMNKAYGNSQHKGDLQGIINSLDYIKSTGVNAIWLTPIFESVVNPGQDDAADRLDGTGYFASNYFKVDPRFGSNDKLKELVDAAHSKGLYVLLDGVFGHFKNNAQNYPSPLGRTVSTSGASQAATGREAVYPDDLAFFKEVATYWVTNYKIDGWRLDQAYQVPVQSWGEIRAAVESAASSVTYVNASNQTVNPLGYMVAELWESGSEINAQGYGSDASPALLSAFNFPMRYTLVQTLAVEEDGIGRTPATNLETGYQTQLAYSDHAMPNLMIDNHDLVRFGDLIQRAGLGNPTDDNYWARHKAAFSFLTDYSGPITIYYGDEVGQEVPNFSTKVDTNCVVLGLCDDHVGRSPGIVEGVAPVIGDAPTVLTPHQADLKLYVKTLMALREAHPALWNGSRTHIYSDTNLFIDRKDATNDNIVYVLNTSTSIANVSLSGAAIGSQGDLVDLVSGTTYSLSSGGYAVQVQPLSAVFLQIKSPSPEGPQTGGSGSLTGTGALADCARPVVAGNGPLGKDMYIRGNYVGGDNFSATPTDHKFSYTGNNIYQVVVNEPSTASYSLKFASSDWSSEFAVQNSAPVTIGTQQVMAPAHGSGTESPIAISQAGNYVFSFEINATNDGGNMMVSKCP